MNASHNVQNIAKDSLNVFNDPRLFFDEYKHEYYVGTKKLISVTKFIHEFFEHFDDVEVAKKISQMPKYVEQGITSEMLIEKWKNIRTDGTFVHKAIEDWILSKKENNNIKFLNARSFLQSFIKDSDELHPEVKVYSVDLGVAGTIDLVIKRGNTIILVDWKTNTEIRKDAFNKKTGILPPTSNVPDSNYWHYTLQLNLYKHILERDYGLKVDELILVHLREENFKHYIMPVVPELIKAMVAYKKHQNVLTSFG